MRDPCDSPTPLTDPQSLLLVVVGANPRAEVAHRPLGYRLCEEIRRWQRRTPQAHPLSPLVCTDLWYLNDQALMARPTIALGEPELNAVSAYFANRLPTALVIEQSLQVQLDPEFVELQACVWGVDDRSTAAGVEAFVERYLDAFLEESHKA